MIAETLLVCWLIACIFLPLLWALTSSPPAEVRQVTNALVRQRAQLIADEPTVVHVTRDDLARYRQAVKMPNFAATVVAIDAEAA